MTWGLTHLPKAWRKRRWYGRRVPTDDEDLFRLLGASVYHDAWMRGDFETMYWTELNLMRYGYRPKRTYFLGTPRTEIVKR